MRVGVGNKWLVSPITVNLLSGTGCKSLDLCDNIKALKMIFLCGMYAFLTAVLAVNPTTNQSVHM